MNIAALFMQRGTGTLPGGQQWAGEASAQAAAWPRGYARLAELVWGRVGGAGVGRKAGCRGARMPGKQFGVPSLRGARTLCPNSGGKGVSCGLNLVLSLPEVSPSGSPPCWASVSPPPPKVASVPGRPRAIVDIQERTALLL